MRKDVLYCHVNSCPGLWILILASGPAAKYDALYSLRRESSQIFRDFIVSRLNLARIGLPSLKSRRDQRAYIHSTTERESGDGNGPFHLTKI